MFFSAILCCAASSAVNMQFTSLAIHLTIIERPFLPIQARLMKPGIIPALLLASAIPTATLGAQQASFVYRLGKDTVAVEQYTRTASKLTGDVVSRTGPVVVRTQYDVTLGKYAMPTAATFKLFGADGKPIRGRPLEVRYTIVGDSAQRVIVWPDSTQARTLAAPSGVPFVGPAYGMLEPGFLALRGGRMPAAGLTLLGVGTGAAIGPTLFSVTTADSIRLPSGAVFRVDVDGRLQSYDGSATTAKLMATRGKGGLDIASIASRMSPTGTLSSRGTARGAFQTQVPGGIMMIDYGRPQVRERTVWGGLLIPLDTIWRLGANEATHFATSRDLDFGGTVLPAGLYTLFLFNATSGPMLVVNKQVGQWGTSYDSAKDVARIPLTMSATPEHVEEFTIAIRQAAPNRGSLEISWGPKMATANFTVK